MSGKLTIILDDGDLKFAYTQIELIKFRRMWKEYRKCTTDSLAIINQVAEDFAMPPDNIALLALDQMKKGEIS